MPPPLEPPAPPPSLDAEHAAALSAYTLAALRNQRSELAASLEEAFAQIPAPLRGAVRRMLGA
jgi:hypothetical protein